MSAEYIRDFHTLKVFEKSINLVEKVYRMTKNIPKAEQYGVISQIQRAVTSIVANIAEGNSFSGQFPKKELNFLAIAKGSAVSIQSLKWGMVFSLSISNHLDYEHTFVLLYNNHVKLASPTTLATLSFRRYLVLLF